MKRRRSDARRSATPGLVGTLAGTGIVGSWEWDPATGRFLLDEGAAALIAGDPRLAGQALHAERATAGLALPEAGRFLEEIRRAAEQEDDVLVQIRVTGSPETPRFLACRGRIQRDERHQPVRVEGTLVDTAEVRPEARALLGLEEESTADAIDEAAELLIAARRAIDASGSRRLRQLVDVMLLEVAREIASRSEPAQRRHH
ncbi:hypothetical protein [Methylorubrum zatmanii]